MPNFMEATLESIRSAVGLAGQREAFGCCIGKKQLQAWEKP